MPVDPRPIRFGNEISWAVAVNRGWACRRFGIDVHPKKLEFEPMEMRNVWDEIHEIGKLNARSVRALSLQVGMYRADLP